MKTHNWQTKALTLFIAAAACMSLMIACDNADMDTEIPSTGEATEAPAKFPTVVPIGVVPEEQTGCTTETPGLTSWLNTSEEEYQDHDENHSRSSAVLYLRRALLWRQPNVYHVGDSFLRDEKGEWTDQWGITVWVTEKVDQNTLPPENRIPEILDGVPVRITEAEPPPKVAASTCDYSMCRANSKEGDNTMTTTNQNTAARRHEVRLKYDPLFWRQPNVHGVGEGFFGDGHGGRLKTKGIVISVTRKVDQSTLPPEDRIPDCLDGIPVQVIEEEPPTIGIFENSNEEENNDSN